MKEKNTNWKLYLIIAVGAIAVILLCVFGVQSSQNKAIDLQESVKAAMSDIRVQEKRRFDLVPNLADAIKSYDKHEAETLMAVVNGRSGNTDADMEEVKLAINAVVEDYPKLASSDLYKDFMNELSITENLISEYRQAYNKEIKNYNRYVSKFPTRIFLDWTGYEVQEFEELVYENTSVDAPIGLFD